MMDAAIPANPNLHVQAQAAADPDILQQLLAA
jgi:hypothetical protein